MICMQLNVLVYTCIHYLTIKKIEDFILACLCTLTFAQMTSKCGENKEAHYKPQASNVTDIFTTF